MKDVAKGFAGVFTLVAIITVLAAAESPAQLSVRVTPVLVDQLNIGDLDFSTGGSRSLLFTVDVQASPPRQVFLTLQVDAQLPDATLINAITLTTTSFSVPRRFTNLDIRSGDIRLGGDVQYSAEAQGRVRDFALATGKFPAGTYTLRLTVQDGTGGSAQDQFTLTIRNLSRLDLISPRDGDVVPNPYPLFMWVYDGDQAQISVYPWLPTNRTEEEASQGTPMLQQVLTGVRTFQYPTAGVRSLEAGKLYVWKVVGLARGTGGKGVEVESEIWQFSVSSGPAMTAGGPGGMTQGQQLGILNQLQNVPGVVPELLNLLSSGSVQITRMSPNSAALVQAILNDLAQNPDKIIEVVLTNQ